MNKQIKAYRDAWLPDGRGTGLDLLTVRFAAMLRDIGPGELVLIIVVVMLLFGAGAAKKLPGAAKSLGQSMRIFKAEMKQMHSDDKD